MELHVFPILNLPPTSLPIRSLWVFPVHQLQALVSCIQPGLAICFTLDSIHVSMLFSRNIPPSPSSSSGDLPDTGIKLSFPMSSSLAGRFFDTEPLGKPGVYACMYVCMYACVCVCVCVCVCIHKIKSYQYSKARNLKVYIILYERYHINN